MKRSKKEFYITWKQFNDIFNKVYVKKIRETHPDSFKKIKQKLVRGVLG